MNTHLTAKGFELESELAKYAGKKLARVKRHVPRKLQSDAECTVVFSQRTRQDTKVCTCAITFVLGDTRLSAKEATAHMYAALDIAVVQIEQQLKAHNRERHSGLFSRRFRAL